MRDDFLTIKQEDVTGWNSQQQDRIALPYRNTGDILFNANLLISDNTPYMGAEDDQNAIAEWDAECLKTLDNSTVSAMLKILPYRRKPLAGIALTVTTADGRHMERKITGTVEPETIEAILDQFFSMGAAGLSSTFRTYWSGTYTEYKRRKAI